MCSLQMLWTLLPAQPDTLQGIDSGLDSLLNLQISTVSKYAQSTDEAPASVTIITHDDIIRYGYNDISELLNTVRDIYISDDRNYSYIGMRGFGRPTDFNSRIGILINGVLVNEPVWGGGPSGSETYGINFEDVDRVEIIRGPSSALYGNHPMFGMINIVTRNGKAVDGATVTAEQGSYGKWQGSLALGKVVRLAAKPLDLHLNGRIGSIAGQRLYYPEYDDSSTNHGVVNKLDGIKYWGYDAGASWGNWRFKSFYMWRDIEVPTGAYGTEFGDPRFHVLDRKGFFELGYQAELSHRCHFQARGNLSHYHYEGYYPYPLADGGLQVELASALIGMAEARVMLDLHPENRLMVGVESDHFRVKYYLDYPDRVVFDNLFAYTTVGAYLQDEWQPMKWLSLSFSGRFDRLYLGNTSFSPRFAANVFFNKHATLKALLGTSFRAPTVYEAQVGFDGYVLPNLGLKPERIRSAELVWEERYGGGITSIVSVFGQKLTNLIDQQTIQDSLLQFQNLSAAGGFGGSAEVTGRLRWGMSFYTSYGFARMLNLEDMQWLSNSPLHSYKAGVSVPLLRHFRISPEVVAQSRRLTVQDTYAKGFVVANCNLIFAPDFQGKGGWANRIQLSLKLRNVLNAKYSYPGGYEHLQAAIQQNGRNYGLRLTVSI